MKRISLKAGKSETRTIENSMLSLLIFTVNGKEYAFSVKTIQEIVNCTGYSELPANASAAHGIISLRGNGVQVFDFNSIVSGVVSQIGKRSCIVIIDVEEVIVSGKLQRFGLLVDSVSFVLEIEREKVEAAPHVGEKSVTDIFSGMIQLDGRFFLILDEKRLYSVLEFKSKINENINANMVGA